MAVWTFFIRRGGNQNRSGRLRYATARPQPEETSGGNTRLMLRKLDYLDEYFGDFKVTEVTGPDMKMRLAEEEEWSAVTRNKTLSYWKAAYNVAKTDLGLISDNPLESIGKFRSNRT